MNLIATTSKFLLISLLALSLEMISPQNTFGRNFYFSTSLGDDTRTSTQAQNPATPWKSIAKLNSFFTNLTAGDSILFMKGDTFGGTIKVTKSGTTSKPIVFSAYGNGAVPVISGFTKLSSWTNKSTNIWQAIVPTSNTILNVVTIDGIQYGMGRYPNSTFLTYESVSGNTSITDNQLTGTPNWTGAEVVIRKIRWMLDRNIITNHVGSTLTYNTGTSWSPTAGFGYFIQNDLKTLDVFGEWYYDVPAKTLKMYSVGNPSTGRTIKVSVLDTLVSILSEDNIILTGLTFEGSNSDAIVIQSSKNVVIKNCNINYSGESAITTTNSSTDAILTIDGNTIDNANNGGITLGNNSTIAWIKNNTIKNINILEGTGDSEGSGDAIAFHCKAIVEYNNIDSVGHSAIVMTNADSMIVRYNKISNYCLTRYDGGGIYTWNADGTFPQGQQIKQNIVLNSNQTGTGIANSTLLNIRGIYCDNNSTNIDIDGNTVYNASTAGIYLLRSDNIKINNNTCFNNSQQLAFKYAYGTLLKIRNLEINNNIFVAKEADQLALYFQSIANDIPLFGKADNNYYARPIDDNATIQTIDPTNGTVNRTLSSWQTYSVQDTRSKKSPKTITTSNDLRFEYNATKASKTIALPGTFIDVKGIKYINSITLKPYTSAVLILSSVSTNQPPVINDQGFQIKEKSSNGTIVGNVIASEPDAGQTLTYSIVSGNTGNAFAINSSSGLLMVATSASLDFQTTPTFTLVIKVQDNGAVYLSDQATITVNLTSVVSCSATGTITYQLWQNIGVGTAITDLTANINYPDNPSSTSELTSFEAPENMSDNSGSRIAGFICAPLTGGYTFWIASNNEGELWLSTDDQPANKRKIAYHTDYTSSRQWNKYTTQKSVVINLTQGKTYYIEALMKEFNNNDNLAVGWLKPGQTGTVPSEVIPGSVLSPLKNPAILVSSISLSGIAIVDEGSTISLTATALPSDASNTILSWTSNNTSVATVSNSGEINGIAPGSAVITAKTTDGSNKSAYKTITVNPITCTATGNITYQKWNNIGTGTRVSDLTSNVNYPNNPSSTLLITSMEAPLNSSENFGARIVGYICAPQTGSYTFWIASNNEGELWLSTDDQAANKLKIAYHTSYTASREWNKYASQKSDVINLIKGKSYYIEALMKEYDNNDNLAIAWLTPGQTGTVPSEIIPGSVLSPINIKSAEAPVQNSAFSDQDINLLVYPNPLNNDMLNIKIENLFSEATLKIYSISGVECHEEKIYDSDMIHIERSLFKSGIYIIKVFNNQFVKTAKLVVK